MEVLESRCVTNDALVAKYKYKSPTSETVTRPQPSKRKQVKKQIFPEQTISAPIKMDTPNPTSETKEPAWEYLEEWQFLTSNTASKDTPPMPELQEEEEEKKEKREEKKKEKKEKTEEEEKKKNKKRRKKKKKKKLAPKLK